MSEATSNERAEVQMEYRYKLTLEVKDHGERMFSAENEFSSQLSMSKEVAYSVARALRMLNSPPTDSQVVMAIGTSGPLLAVALCEDRWDGERDFDEAVTVVVDIDKLMPSCTEQERRVAASILADFGAVVKGQR